jgi:hypothetical protein
MIICNPTLHPGNNALSIQTSCDLNGKRYIIKETEGVVVRAGTFTGYSNEFAISICGLKVGNYKLMVEEESISFKVDKI